MQRISTSLLCLTETERLNMCTSNEERKTKREIRRKKYKKEKYTVRSIAEIQNTSTEN